MSASVHLPWQYSPFDIHGRLTAPVTSLDAAPSTPFERDDLARLVAQVASGNQFDGDVRMVVLLRDGRSAAWSLSYISTEGINLHALLVAQTPAPLVAALGMPP